ncbi:MAG: hypothetical protein IJ316_03615 [Clostridia bacterium]|nr:hypothetical protein [Clostridia bacterium]
MFLIVCIVLLIFPDAAAEGAREGLEVGFNTVVCSVLPFAVAASALIRSGQGRVIGALCSPFFKKLRLNPYGSVAFFSSALGGYPTGAGAVCDMYEERLIGKEEAEDILAYANNGGIIFAINIIGKIAFSSIFAGVLVWVFQLLGALLTGCIMSRGSVKTVDITARIEKCKKEKPSYMAVFGKSIASGGVMLINIVSAFVVFYALIEAIGLERYPFLAGLCEIVKGVNYASEVNSLSLAALFFAFGGVSVFVQCGAVCAKHNFKMTRCIVGKALTGVFAYIFTYSTLLVMKGRFDVLVLSLCAVCVIVSGCLIFRKIKKHFQCFNPLVSQSWGMKR